MIHRLLNSKKVGCFTKLEKNSTSTKRKRLRRNADLVFLSTWIRKTYKVHFLNIVGEFGQIYFFLTSTSATFESFFSIAQLHFLSHLKLILIRDGVLKNVLEDTF